MSAGIKITRTDHTAEALRTTRSSSLHGRWIAAGNQAELAVYPGGAHGFTLFPGSLAQGAQARIDAFLWQLTAQEDAR